MIENEVQLISDLLGEIWGRRSQIIKVMVKAKLFLPKVEIDFI